MKRRDSLPDRGSGRTGPWTAGLLLFGGALLVLLLVVNRRDRHQSRPVTDPVPTAARSPHRPSPYGPAYFGGRIRPTYVQSAPTVPNPTEVVAGKIARFIDGRRALLHGYAAYKGLRIPDEMARFFDIAASNRWDEIHDAYIALWQRNRSEPPPEFQTLWPVILETYGVLEAAHQWPAQALLDYGNLVLSSVPPGGVYLGGTDEGRFIPTLLNTDNIEPRIVMTQNSLADATYLDYQRFALRDRLTLPSQAEVEQAFAEVVAQHGKDDADGIRRVGGQAAVMAINSRLVAAMARANPDRPFAIQESYPMSETYAGASLAGSLYQFQSPAGAAAGGIAEGVSPESAVAFWQETASRIALDPEASSGEVVRNAYAKLATGQASLLVAQGHRHEAEQTLRAALQFTPALPEATFRLAQILQTGGRTPEAIAIVDQAIAYAALHPSANGDATAGFLALRQQLATPKP